MSEDEAVNILKTMCTDNFCIEQLKTKQAIETILDLYKQEKEKNSKLQKRNDKQFRLLRKKDKEIQEIKDISEHDWEERCRLTFKLEDYISKDKIKEILEKYEYTEIGDTMKIIEFYKAIQNLLEEN